MLGLWQMAESLTLADERRGDTRLVANRLSVFAHERNLGEHLDVSHLTDAILFISHKRNEFVHKGLYGCANDDDINVLKLMCELGLEWLYNNLKTLPTQTHVRRYLELYSRNDNDLEAISTCVRFLQSSRHSVPN